jgi:uncharacterized protein HemX
MSRSVWCAVALLALLAAAGCNTQRSQANKLAKERVAVTEQMAVLFEGVTDRSSKQRAEPEYKALMDKLREVNEKLDALPKDVKTEALNLNSIQYDQATERLAKAKEKASKF